MLDTFPTRIPVRAGDDIGIYINGPGSVVHPCVFDTSFTDHYDSADDPPGTTNTFTVENFQPDVSAILEPDADHDGFGDETQDQCPTDASTQGPCPATGQRASALASCKKRAHKHHRSHKRLRKRKKGANRLPV